MVFDDNSYSRMVAWLKVILPLLALLLLSTLFLVARTVDPAQQLPFADVDIDEIAREQRIGRPNYTGVTTEGAAIALSARAASPAPDDADRLTGDDVHAEIELPNGEAITVRADQMDLNPARGIATLSQAVNITTAGGYALRTASLDIALDRTYAESTTPTEVSGGLGQLRSNGFELKLKEGSNSSYLLVFKGDVKLVYNPQE